MLINLNFCSDIFTRLYYYFISRFYKTKEIPSVDDVIIFSSATVLAEKIRTKQLTSERVVSAFIERCRQVNPIVNAIIDERFDDALKDARYVDSLIQRDEINFSELKTKKPLFGIPVTIKGSYKVKGMKFTIGIKAFAERKSQCNSLAVDLLINAGAIPIALTNIPPACRGLETVNDIIGQTLNPYNQKKSIGGSSGGEAALISSGASIIGLASDSLGSIRIPSSFANIYGHKPSKGTIVTEDLRMFANSKLVDLFTVGPMCRYAEDLDLLMNVLTEGRYSPSNLIDVKSIKIYYLEEFKNVVYRVCPEIKEKISSAVKYFHETYNCEIEQLDTEDINNFHYIFKSWSYTELQIMFSGLCKKLEKTNIIVGTIAKICQIIMNLVLPVNEKEYCTIKSEQIEKLKRKLSTNAVLILPTYQETVFYKNQGFFKMSRIYYCAIFSILNFTATTVPVGFDAQKMPLGLQVIGAPGQDQLCIAVTRALHKYFGGWKPPFSNTKYSHRP
ncbi:hypothetical protein PGB90_006852 [Kerria lacca]